MSGDAGNDRVEGLDGKDELFGEEGDDNLIGGAGNDTLHGGSGNNILEGGLGADRLEGNGGLSLAYYHNAATGVQVFLDASRGTNTGEASGDTFDGVLGIQGSIYDDVLVGDAARNYLSGEEGNDTLKGGAEGDDISGGKGDDTLWGETGDDTLAGGEGVNLLIGGDGADTFDGTNGWSVVSYETSTSSVRVGPRSFRPTMEGMLSATTISTSTLSSGPHTTTR